MHPRLCSHLDGDGGEMLLRITKETVQ